MDFDFTTETITTDLSNNLLVFGGVGALQLTTGTTAQRPGAAVAGAIRYNSSLSIIESFIGGSWVSTSGSVTSVGLALPSIFTVTGSPVTAAGTLTATLATQSANNIFAGPTSFPNAVPTFRTIGLAQNDLNDVTITSASATQILSYSGSRWVNTSVATASATGTVGVTPAGGGTAWTLVSGTRYTANFVHNLGTTNVVITLYDTNDNSVVIAQSLVVTDSNTVTIVVTGNTKTIKVVVVANGLAIAAGGSTPSSVITALNGVVVSTAATTVNFAGQAINATAAGGTTTVNIGSRFTYYSNSLDSPNNADWAVNALAPVTTDPTYNSLTVRSFSNTAELGVGFMISIPTSAQNITFKIKGRSGTAPTAASVIQMNAYFRLIPNNAAMGAWVGPLTLPTLAIPTNANFQYGLTSSTLAAAGLVAGNTYQFELTRANTGVTNNLAFPFYMVELTVEVA